MRFYSYIFEDKLVKSPINKGVYIIQNVAVKTKQGNMNVDKIYVYKIKSQKAYVTSLSYPMKNMDDMVSINGEYWFGTLKEIRDQLKISPKYEII